MSQEMSKAAQQKITKLLKITQEMNAKYERDKWEHQECMKAKEKEKERQMEEQAKMTESTTENIAPASSVTVKTEQGCITTIE